jgi:hypothetical protein
MRPTQNIRSVRLTHRLVVINLWNYHSHLNRGLAIIIEALSLRMQRLDTWSQTAIVHLDRPFLGYGTSFWRPLLTHHLSHRSQHGHNRLFPGMNNAIPTILVHIRLVNTHHMVYIHLRNLMDRIPCNMTAGLIFPSWTPSPWPDNSPKDRQFTLMQAIMGTAGN